VWLALLVSSLGLPVEDMHNRFASRDPRPERARRRQLRVGAEELGVNFRNATRCRSMEPLAVISPQNPECRAAQMQRLLQHRLEHRGKIAGRRIDDAEHLGRCGLPGQGFVSLSRDGRLSRQSLITLGCPLVELALKIGDGLLKIEQRATGRRAHLRSR